LLKRGGEESAARGTLPCFGSYADGRREDDKEGTKGKEEKRMFERDEGWMLLSSIDCQGTKTEGWTFTPFAERRQRHEGKGEPRKTFADLVRMTVHPGGLR